MSTLAEIEAVLPKLSPGELARVEAVLRSLRREREVDARFDGQPWPATPQETAAELAEMDALPPLLSPAEADRFDAWLAAERERQKALAKSRGEEISTLFT
jgi:hypothetical protein